MCSRDIRQDRPELRIKDSRRRSKSRDASFLKFKGGRGVGELANLKTDISDDYYRVWNSSKVFLSSLIDCVENIFVSGQLEDALQYEKRLLDIYEQRKFYRILNHCLSGVEYFYSDGKWIVEVKKKWSWKSYPVYHFVNYARSGYHALKGRKRRNRDFDDAIQNYVNEHGWKS